MTVGMQFYFRQQPYQFRFKAGLFWLSLFFFILFCLLGSWQIQRYHFKQSLLAEYQERFSAPARPLLAILNSGVSLQFQHVWVQGQFSNAQTVLLQNQLHEGRVGYEVLTPLQVSDTKNLLLVDRGWLPADKLKTLQPEKQSPVTVEGYVKLINEQPFILGKNIYNTQAVPLVLQRIDLQALSEITHQSFFPFILRLNSAANDGLTRQWPVTTTIPEKHFGYAIQWFAMAFTLFIAFFCFCCEKIRHDQPT